MITLFVLLVLFIGAYAGYKKGIVMQLLQTIGYALVLIFAKDNYRFLSEKLYLLLPYPTPFAPEANPYRFYDERLMLSMDESYYDISAYLIILVVGWLVIRFLTKLLSYTLEKMRVPEPLSGVGGSILGFGVNYMGLFFVLFLLTTIPYDGVQDRIADNFLTNKIVTSTPAVSDRAYQTFILEVNQRTREEEPLLDIQSTDEESTEE